MLEVNDIVKVISATDSGYYGSHEETNIEEYCYHKGQDKYLVD